MSGNFIDQSHQILEDLKPRLYLHILYRESGWMDERWNFNNLLNVFLYHRAGSAINHFYEQKPHGTY